MKLLLGTVFDCARQQVHATNAFVMCTDRHAQHSTAQHSTAQHSTAQHSTAQQADWFACIASVDAEARGHWGSAIREG